MTTNTKKAIPTLKSTPKIKISVPSYTRSTATSRARSPTRPGPLTFNTSSLENSPEEAEPLSTEQQPEQVEHEHTTPPDSDLELLDFIDPRKRTRPISSTGSSFEQLAITPAVTDSPLLTQSTPSLTSEASTKERDLTIKAPFQAITAKRRASRMGHTRIKPFKGLKNGKEDPIEFLEDLEWAYEQSYEDKTPADPIEAAVYLSRTHRVLFRQALEGKAADWYADLEPDVKTDWSKLQELFKTAFKITVKDAQAKKFELKIKLHNLEQSEGESISDFLDRAEELSMKLPQDDIDVGMAMLRGMRDVDKRERVSFECNKDADYSFANIKKLIKAAYSEVGKLSPFDPGYKESMQVTLTGGGSAVSTDELLRQVLLNTTAAFPAILQGMRSLNTAMSQGAPLKQPTGQNAYGGQAQKGASKTYRPLSEIQCFDCKEMGHFMSHCPHRQAPQITAKAVMPTHPQDSEEDEIMAGRMIFPYEEEYPAMAATRPNTRAAPPEKPTYQPAGIQKPAKKQVQKRLPQGAVDQIYQDNLDLSQEGQPQEMEIEETQSQTQAEGNGPLQQSTSRANVGIPPPNTRITKTGKVQELVVPKGVRIPDPMRGMVGQERFNVDRILRLPVEMSLGEFLDRSDITVKELAFNLQKAVPRYRIRKQKAPETRFIPGANAVTSARSAAPTITARALEDDGRSSPLMVTAWIHQTKLPRTLLDGGSLIELISQKAVNRLQPSPYVFSDGQIRVSLANDSLTTLTRYVRVPVNIEGVEAVIKAWIVPVEVYDLLLGVGWMRRMHFNTHYGQGKITISGDDQIVRPIPAQIAPIEAGLPTIEMDEDDEMTADEACQYILDDQENAQL